MYIDTINLLDRLKDYSSPKSKITTMVEAGQITRIKRGIYIEDDGYDLKVLANAIYGPSYISFEYALSWYGMIPERVQAVTSAVFNKNKDKVFETPVGKFIYRYINPLVYFHGVIRNDDYSEPFLIASKEKAVCDTLSKIRSHGEKLDIEMLLLEDMRIDEDILLSLNKDDIDFLSKIYKKTLITDFSEYLAKRSK